MRSILVIIMITTALSVCHGSDLNKIQTILSRSTQSLINDQISNQFWNYISVRLMGLKDLSEIDEDRLKSELIRSRNKRGFWFAVYDKYTEQTHYSKEDFSATVINYFALKLLGHPEDNLQMIKTREFIKANGGLENTQSDDILLLLALTGQIPWDKIKKVNRVILNSWSPISIDDFAHWATTALLAFSYIRSLEQVIPLEQDGNIVSLD